ncbi:hypothetical protein V6N11_001973 [Hibiscus sabdariffa]|uniref:Uncharacterized protein n=1 Tax=Hibiscus sabdariffa TaxID=183260 RepID=A0ABR2QU32_9ROSI
MATRLTDVGIEKGDVTVLKGSASISGCDLSLVDGAQRVCMGHASQHVPQSASAASTSGGSISCQPDVVGFCDDSSLHEEGSQNGIASNNEAEVTTHIDNFATGGEVGVVDNMAPINGGTTEDDTGVAGNIETGPMAAAEAVTSADREATPSNNEAQPPSQHSRFGYKYEDNFAARTFCYEKSFEFKNEPNLGYSSDGQGTQVGNLFPTNQRSALQHYSQILCLSHNQRFAIFVCMRKLLLEDLCELGSKWNVSSKGHWTVGVEPHFEIKSGADHP